MSHAVPVSDDDWIAGMSRAGQQSFSVSELAAQSGLSQDSVHRAINRLIESGRVVRLQRGRYLVAPPSAATVASSPSEGQVLRALITDRGGQYQLCGAITFQRYGWDDQIPQRVSAYNTIYSGEKQVGTACFNFIRVSEERLGGTLATNTTDGAELVWPTKARALVDAVYDWSRFNSLPNAYDWIRSEMELDDGFAADLTDAAVRYGNQGTVRRIGRLLADLDAPMRLIQRLEQHIAETTSFIAWDPSRPKRGSIDRHWGVIINDQRQ